MSWTTRSNYTGQRTAVPCGLMNGSGAVVYYAALGHTLICAASGSGKGSLLWTYLMGADSYLSGQGFGLDVYGWDPKHAEFAGLDGRRFKRIAFTPDDGLELLRSLVGEMRKRQDKGQRSFVPTSEQPYALLAIDEFNTLSVASDAKWKKEVRESLLTLLSQGRSAGMYVIAAAQQPQKELIGEYRPYFMNHFCGRVETPLEVDMVLGVGASELAPAYEIEPATESNGYRTAGIFYGRSIEGVMARFRAPKITDEDIFDWVGGDDSNGKTIE